MREVFEAEPLALDCRRRGSDDAKPRECGTTADPGRPGKHDADRSRPERDARGGGRSAGDWHGEPAWHRRSEPRRVRRNAGPGRLRVAARQAPRLHAEVRPGAGISRAGAGASSGCRAARARAQPPCPGRTAAYRGARRCELGPAGPDRRSVQGRIGHLARRRAHRAIAYRPAAWNDASAPTPDRLHPVQMLRPLQAVLDGHPDSVLVCDGGEIGQWATACLSAPHRVINGVAGSIGAGLPYALAARCARPGAPVLAVMGDGTIGFHIAEFDTAVRYGLPFVCVVGNDARWNAEYQIQLRDYGAQRLIGCELLPTRYDAVVRAFGGHGEHVSDAIAMAPAVERALAEWPARVRERDDRRRRGPADQALRSGAEPRCGLAFELRRLLGPQESRFGPSRGRAVRARTGRSAWHRTCRSMESLGAPRRRAFVRDSLQENGFMKSPAIGRSETAPGAFSIGRRQFVRENSCRHIERCGGRERRRLPLDRNGPRTGRRRACRCVAGVRPRPAPCEKGSQQRCTGHRDGDRSGTQRRRPASRHGVRFHTSAPSTRRHDKCLARRGREQPSTEGVLIRFADRRIEGSDGEPLSPTHRAPRRALDGRTLASVDAEIRRALFDERGQALAVVGGAAGRGAA